MTTLIKKAQAGYNNNVFFKNIPYYTQFLPTTIPGCVIWLDGNDPAGNGVKPANGSTVSTWYDKSGNANNGTAVNTPTYALSSRGIATSSGAYFTLPNGAFPYNDSSYTYFFVFTTTTTGSVNSLFGGGVPGSTRSTLAVRLGTNGANNVIQTYWWANGINDLIVTNTYSANVISLAETWYSSGGTRTITLNFAGSNTDSPAASGGRLQANTNNFLGLAYPGDGALSGFHYEFIVYNTSLSTPNRQLVESYLAQKWGLVTSLPLGHLNATFPAGSPTTINTYIPSTIRTITTKIYIPGIPTVSTPTISGSTLTLNWSATPTTTWSGGSVTAGVNGYIVTILGNGSTVTTQTLGNVLTTTYSSMTGGVAYSFNVVAFNSAGQSAASVTSSTVTYALAPLAPTALVATNSSGTLNMSWTAPTSGGTVSTYTVSVYNSSGPTPISTQTGITGLTATYVMTAGNTYYFTVVSVGPGGSSSASTQSSSITYTVTPLANLAGISIYTSTNSTNWTNNWQPYLNAVVSCNAVSNITATYSKITISNFTSAGWFLGVTYPDGSIYYAPYNSPAGILKFTPATSATTFVGTASGITYSNNGAQWYDGCLAPDGYIYYFPTNYGKILKYYPPTDTASLITIPIGTQSGLTYANGTYRGCILGPNGSIYLSPYNAASIFKFNPSDVTFSNIPVINTGGQRWEGCSLGPDGKIYMTNFSATTTFILLDTSTTPETVSYPAAGTTTAQTYRGGATLAANGNLYFPPSVTNLGVLYYNSSSGGNLISHTASVLYRDSHLGPDGKVYITPNNGGTPVIVVDPTTNTLSDATNALGLNLQGANMGLDGNIYGTAQGTGSILKIQFNNVAYPLDSNYILSPYVNHC